jgi:transcriptional repressor NrdR
MKGRIPSEAIGMRCPFCGVDKDRVIDSRSMAEGRSTRRRRECLACKRRFTTYENVDEIHVLVVKRDGRREEFDRSKIESGLRKACHKRPIPAETLLTMTGEIEQAVLAKGDKEVQSGTIGEMVMERLQAVDQVAYVRFASVYRSFQDVTEFMSIISQFAKKPGKAKDGKRKGKGKGK